MEGKNLEQMDNFLTLDRTDKLFDSSISRADSNNTNKKYTPEDIKTQRLVIGFGNLHINTAKTKLAIVRMRGYANNIKSLKQALERKVRNKRKYGGQKD